MIKLKAATPLAILLATAACGGGSEPPDETGTAISQHSSASGDAQTGIVGQPLSDPIQVVVTDNGSAAAGVTVNWVVTAGGGEVAPPFAPTDGNGVSGAIWALGDAPGSQTVQATVDGATGSPVTFTATAVEDPGAAPETAAVTVRDNNFLSTRNSSSNAAVDTVQVGGSVTWTWDPQANAHNVTSAGSPSFNGQPTATDPPPFTVTFNSPGTYNYYCTLHGAPGSGMRGRIVVR
jgi:plastocyanin